MFLLENAYWKLLPIGCNCPGTYLKKKTRSPGVDSAADVWDSLTALHTRSRGWGDITTYRNRAVPDGIERQWRGEAEPGCDNSPPCFCSCLSNAISASLCGLPHRVNDMDQLLRRIRIDFHPLQLRRGSPFQEWLGLRLKWTEHNSSAGHRLCPPH